MKKVVSLKWIQYDSSSHSPKKVELNLFQESAMPKRFGAFFGSLAQLVRAPGS